MAAYAITKYITEDYDPTVVAANLETHIETLDSTNNPIVLCDIVYNAKTGKFVGIVLAD